MECNEQNKQKNRNRLKDTENRLTIVKGKGTWGLGEKVKGLSKKNPKKPKKPHRHRQQYGDYQRESGVAEAKESKVGINGDESRFDSGC